MKKLILALITILFVLANQSPIHAQETDPPYYTYLPLVSYQEVEIEPTRIGPGGGPVVVILTHPSNKDIVYAGTWGAGVFMSQDAGETWQPKNMGLNNFYINSMGIDPINPKILYAGTYKDKLYKSTDGGDTWYQSSNGIQSGAIVYCITIDPNNPDIVFIGTRGENSTGAPPWKGIVYRSTNEGINWTPVLQNVPRAGENSQDWAYDLLVNPKNSSIVFAAMHEAGIYKSINGGTTWSPSNSGITENGGIISGRGLSINPVGFSDALYMGTWHRFGVFKSTNNAANWTRSALDVKVYNMDLDDSAPGTLYLANFDQANNKGGIYKTTNSSGNWTLVGLGSEIMYTVEVNQPNHNQVFAGTLFNGIYRSDNAGSNWKMINQGLWNTNAKGIVSIPGESKILYGAVANNGVSKSTDNGQTWQLLNNGLGDKAVNGLLLNPANPNQLFALTATGGLYRCTLPDCIWSSANSGIPTAAIDPRERLSMLMDANQILELELAGFVTDSTTDLEPKASAYKKLNEMQFAPSDSSIVYLATGGGGVLRSSNSGVNWSAAGLGGKTVNSIAIDPLNPAILYAATDESGIIKYSNNSGGAWTNTNIPGRKTSALSISAANPPQVYAATDRGVYTNIGSGPWTLLGLDGLNILSIAAHPQRSGVLVAGSDRGAYYSLNNGLTWTSFSNEISALSVYSIQFDVNNFNKVYLGTSTMGTYRYLLP